MNVLVLNCGSSSVKFQLIATDLEQMERDAGKRLAHGLIERIGGAGIVTFTAEGAPVVTKCLRKNNHRDIEIAQRRSCASEFSG